MIPMSSSTASEVLTRRVQALLIQAWIRVALYGMSLLLGVAVTSVTLMAFIDYSIRTEHFWLEYVTILMLNGLTLIVQKKE